MISLGLKRSEQKKFERLLFQPHCVYVRVQMMDLSHAYLGDVSKRLLGGQVNIDADAEVTRSLELDLFDPNNSLRISSEDPDDGAMFMDRMVKVWYCIAPPDKSIWYDCPVFTGPITKVNRTNVTVKVEAQGKEALAFGSLWRTKTYRKGLKKTTVMRRILANLAGERKISIPDMDERITRNLSLGLESVPWKESRRLANTLERQLFYDGRGVAVLRRRPLKTKFTITEDALVKLPEISYDTSEMKNAVMVIGAKPKGGNKRIRVRKVAPRSHPLSPWRLGRYNSSGKYVPRYIPLIVKNDNVRTKKAARRLAKKTLRGLLVEAVEVTAETMPIPHLEPLDVYRIKTSQFSAEARLRKMTIPLVASGTASIGVLKRTTPKRKPIAARRR